jgi:hypothetical protein
MHTVNNKPYQNFDSYIDLQSLLKLKPFISAYLARNNQYCIPTKFSRVSFGADDSYKVGIQDAVNYYRENFNLYNDSLKSVIENLIANDQFGSFVVFENDVVYTSLSFNTRYIINGLNNKHLPEYTKRTPMDHELNFFYNWLDCQNIFQYYGRVNFFINHPGSYQLPHTDPDDPTKDLPDEFIWINFSPDRKKFYVLDDENQKIYVPGYINWFNTKNLHGGDIVEYSCYSLRIDGKFTEEFKSKFKTG